jgi:hypothetical protein
MNKTDTQLFRKRTVGFFYLALVCFFNTAPLFVLSVLANLNSVCPIPIFPSSHYLIVPPHPSSNSSSPSSNHGPMPPPSRLPSSPVSSPQPSPASSASSCPSSSAGYHSTKVHSPNPGSTAQSWGGILRFWSCRSWSYSHLLGLYLVSRFMALLGLGLGAD